MEKFTWKNIVKDVNSGFDEFKKTGAPFYHYTSVKSFLSIMSSREFWMSNIHFMNDEQEFYDGQGMCKKVIADMMETEPENQIFLNTLFTKFGNNMDMKYPSYLRTHDISDSMVLCSNDIYGISFCRDRNLLSQWQNYGEHGVAIGFDETVHLDDMTRLDASDEESDSHTMFVPTKIYENQDKSKKAKSEFVFSVTDVIYDEKKKMQIIKSVIESGIRNLSEKVGLCESDNEKNELLESTVAAVTGALFYFFTYMKNAAFRQEKECRFVYSFSKTQQKNWPDLIDFREKDGQLIPYIRLKIIDSIKGTRCEMPIKEIVVAPGENKNFAAAGIRYFLEHSGYEYLVDKVRVSDIPYRG